MIRATTPTHTFTFPQNINDTYSEILITYMQKKITVLELRKSDLSISGKNASYTLSQEQTNKFKEGELVEVQVRVKSLDGSQVAASKIYSMPVNRVLNDEAI